MAILKSRKNLSGVHAKHMKKTENTATVLLDIPAKVTIPMLQHMGRACTPLVQKGDHVCVGQKIGDTDAFLSSPVHASCSGVVSDIVELHNALGMAYPAVVIETDGEQTVDPSVKKPEVNTFEEFIAAVRESGLVGLGGAGFPTAIKLNYKDLDKIQALVINAAECEPFITADYRESLENTQDIVNGVELVKKFTGVKKVYIGIESNKPKSIELLNQAFAFDPDVTVVQLKSIYPQGAEKSIIYACTGIVVERGKLPADCGAIVMNISSVGFLGRYFETGLPLTTRRVTVDGDFVTNPANLLVPIGTPVQALLDYCGIGEEYGKVLMGGPMMGSPIIDLQTPIVKNSNAVTVLSEKASETPKPTACIRCGKCISACPMKLMPAKLERAYDARDGEQLEKLAVDLCINCGCCSYICPAKRPLAQKNQLAKKLLPKKGDKK